MNTSQWAAIISGFYYLCFRSNVDSQCRWPASLCCALVFFGAASLANAQVTFFNDGAGLEQDLPFSESVRVDGLLFVSGQVGTDVSGKLVDGGIQAESRQVMENIRRIVQRRGLTMRDIVKCTVFLADVSQWGDFNKIYTLYFSQPYPARSALGANGLALGAALEVECIAAYPQTQNHGQ